MANQKHQRDRQRQDPSRKDQPGREEQEEEIRRGESGQSGPPDMDPTRERQEGQGKRRPSDEDASDEGDE